MKRAGILSIVMIILCIAVLGCVFFPLLNVDLSPVMDETIPFSQQLNGVSGILGSPDSETMLVVNGKAVLTTITKGTADLGSAGKELMRLLRVFILIPCICAVLVLLLSLFRKTWTKVLAFIFSAAGFLTTILSLVWVLPSRLGGMIADKTGDTVSAVVTRITEGETEAVRVVETVVNTADIRNQILRGVKPALWVMTAVLGLLLILSIIRLFGKNENVTAGGSTISQPSFRCTDGPLAGETIPIGPKDEITFGSDPAYANMVIERSEIAPLHCRISYSQERETFCVFTYDDAPVLLKGKRLKSGENELKRGSEIFLGFGDCSIQLL